MGTWINVKVFFRGNLRFERCNLEGRSFALDGMTSEEAKKLTTRMHCTENSLLAAIRQKGGENVIHRP